MINSTFGLTRELFCRNECALLPQQAEAVEMIGIHAQHGGFSVVVGHPGVGKSVLRAHLEQLGKGRDAVVVSFTQTLHTYQPILRLLAESLHRLSLMCNEDIKSRISYSKQLLPLADADLIRFIVAELAEVGLGTNTFDEVALQVVARAVRGNLRLCRNLCYAALVAACLDRQRICTVSHVNAALQQPHWRSHEALLKQQAKAERGGHEHARLLDRDAPARRRGAHADRIPGSIA